MWGLKMQTVNIVVVGTGKTTFIDTIKDVSRPLAKPYCDLKLPDGSPLMDFGEIDLGQDVFVWLFGIASAPDDRYEEYWRTVCDGMLGFILLADDMDATKYTFAKFRSYAPVEFVLVAEHPETIAPVLGVDLSQVMTCDMKVSKQTQKVLIELLYRILNAMEANDGNG